MDEKGQFKFLPIIKSPPLQLNRWIDKLQPSVGDPLYQCSHGPIAVKAINEMHE